METRTGTTFSAALISILLAFGTASATEPVAHWAFDENNGTVAGDSAGDSNGFLYGPTWQEGYSGSALFFDGFDDYVHVPAPLTGTTLTVTGWIDPDGQSSLPRNIFTAGPESCEVFIPPFRQEIRFRIDTRGSGGSRTWITAGIAASGWQHFAASFDGSTMRLYVDGTLRESADVGHGVINEPLEAFLGSARPGLSHYLGLLDDVRVYDVVLSDTEIMALFSSSNAPPMVDAGPDRVAVLPEDVQMDGTVTDDGLPNPPSTLSLEWTVVTGSGVSFDDPGSEDVTVSFVSAGTYVLRLTASDGEFVVSDTVAVTVSPGTTVNQPPSVDAGPDLGVVVGAVVSLNAAVSDDGLPNPPASTTTLWALVTGPAMPAIGSPTSPGTTAVFPVEGTYTLRIVADDSLLAGSDELMVFATEGTPGGSLGIVEAEHFNDGGEGVGYHDTTSGDLGGAGYRPGESVDVYSGGSNGHYVGHYRTGEWLAYDVEIPSTQDYVVSLRLMGNVAIPRQLSIWVDGVNLTGEITVEVVESGLWFDFTYPGLHLTQGWHELRLVAESNSLNLDYFELLGAAVNTPPEVDVGPDASLQLPALLPLNGTVTDDGQIYPAPSLSWSKVSGPGLVSFDPLDAADTVAAFQVAGTYVLELTAFDGEEFGADTLTVTVEASSLNQPPVAYDQFVTVMANTPRQIQLDFEDTGGPEPYQFLYGTPAHGMLGGSSDVVVYTPVFGYSGDDSFSWTVSDGEYSASATVSISVSAPPSGGAIVIDHTDLGAFDRIPDQYLAAARNLRVLFSDRSVGVNTDLALNCFVGTSWEAIPNSCKRDYSLMDAARGFYETGAEITDPLLLFPVDATRFDRGNWRFEYFSDSWYTMVEQFVTTFAPNRLPDYDLVTFQYSYLNTDPSLIDPECGFLAIGNRSSCAPHLQDWHVGRIEQLEVENPDKFFLHWTTSLPRMNEPVLTRFNEDLRQYVRQNDKVLFDFADIESHNPDGTPCFDAADGIPYYLDGVLQENFPNDGVNAPAICRRYTTEASGGHLGSVSGGKVQVVKGFWLVMACIAGWDDPACGP